jgi:hypothetical protein
LIKTRESDQDEGILNVCVLCNNLNNYTTEANMPPDDGRMTETCCGNNIRGGEEELLC